MLVQVLCKFCARNDFLSLRNDCVEGVRGNEPIVEKLWRVVTSNHFFWNHNVVIFFLLLN